MFNLFIVSIFFLCAFSRLEENEEEQILRLNYNLIINYYEYLLIFWSLVRLVSAFVSLSLKLSTSLPLPMSSDVTLACTKISRTLKSALESQQRIFLSQCPLMIADPALSDTTKSLQQDPANFVSIPLIIKDLNK